MYDITHLRSLTYSVEVERLIENFVLLIFNVMDEYHTGEGTILNLQEYVDCFKDEFYTSELKIDKSVLLQKYESEDVQSSKKSLISEISTNLNNIIEKNIDKIDIRCLDNIILINKQSKFLYSYVNDSEFKSNRISQGIITYLTTRYGFTYIRQFLRDSRVSRALRNIEKFESSLLFNGLFSIEEQDYRQPLPIIDIKLLDSTKLESEEVDVNDYFINRDQILKRFNFIIYDEDPIYLIKRDDVSIGIKTGESFIPFHNIDIKGTIYPQCINDYYWALLKSTILYIEKKNPPIEELNLFISKSKDTEFCKLLSSLKQNLYVDFYDEIAEDYKNFFEQFLMIPKLSHVEDIQHYVPQASSGSAMSIYTEKKIIGRKQLLHYLEHDSQQKLRIYNKATKEAAKDKKVVGILKPQIAFYFAEKYFEDLMTQVLEDLKLDFIANSKLKKDKKDFKEIDFLVYTKKTIYYVEAKTKLNAYYIKDFIDCASIINTEFKTYFGDDIKLEFLLISSLSDKTVEEYKFFISKADEPDYNNPRASFASIPYYFDVPIQDLENKSVTCIAEPDFEKLKNLMDKILCTN